MQALLLVSLLQITGCGGSAVEPVARATHFAAQIAAQIASTPAEHIVVQAAPEARSKAAALGPNDPIDATAALDWAEWKFPTLLPKGPSNISLDYLGVRYTVRVYANGNNLGITTSGGIYGLGVFTAQVLQSFGSLADYAASIRADRCSVYPGSCANNQFNECQPLALNSLATGSRFHAEYEVRGTVAGSLTLDSVVDGPATFLGQQAVRLTLTQTAVVAGLGTSTTVSRLYLQADAGGLTRTLGDESTTDVGGRSSSSRTVYEQPFVDNFEFTLAPGQSFTSTLSSTTTSLQPPGPPERDVQVTTITFVARESITEFGRSYDTCRYTEVDASPGGASTTTWYHVGTGIPVRIVESDGFGNAGLRQASVNGVPL